MQSKDVHLPTTLHPPSVALPFVEARGREEEGWRERGGGGAMVEKRPYCQR